MEYITEETIKKIQETIKKKQESINNETYFCSEILEEEIINEMLDIIRDGQPPLPKGRGLSRSS